MKELTDLKGLKNVAFKIESYRNFKGIVGPQSANMHREASLHSPSPTFMITGDFSLGDSVISTLHFSSHFSLTILWSSINIPIQ